jgi:hypothetical protein
MKGSVLELARKLVEDMEAPKHRDQPELLEVRLLEAIERAEQSYLAFEVLRRSDIAQGGTDSANPPCKGALFDEDGKRWFITLQTLEDLLELAEEVDCRLVVLSSAGGQERVIEILDTDDDDSDR